MKHFIQINLRIVVIFSALVMLFSCSKEDEVPETRGNQFYFELEKSQITSQAEGQEFFVSLSTNHSWELKSKPEWIEISPENGNTDVDLKISVSQNITSNPRTNEVEFESFGKTYSLKITQNTFPLSLVSYSGSEGPIKMAEKKYLIFNKAVTLNSIRSGDELYSFRIGADDVEYFENNHGIAFSAGPANLGGTHNYIYSVSDSEGNTLEGSVDFEFFSQKIIVPGEIRKMIQDEEQNIWILTVKVWEQGEPSYIIKYSENEGKYEEVLRFEVGLDYTDSSFTQADFFINPYNNYIYIPNWEGEVVEVYSKTGTSIKKISIPGVESDHPSHPHSRPYSIGFNNEGKGIIALAGRGISGIKWRFIDSSNDDEITEPNEAYPFFGLQQFTLNNDGSKLYAIEDRSPEIKVFNGTEEFDIIRIKDYYPQVGDAASLTQNRLNNKLYVNGLYNQQIITPDFSYLSKQSFAQAYVGDFCYDPNLSNHIYALTNNSDASLRLLDYDNQQTVFDYPVIDSFNWTNGRGITTTPDDNYLIMYSNASESNTSTQSKIMFFRTEMFK